MKLQAPRFAFSSLFGGFFSPNPLNPGRLWMVITPYGRVQIVRLSTFLRYVCLDSKGFMKVARECD